MIFRKKILIGWNAKKAEFFLCKNVFSKFCGLMFSRKKNLFFVFNSEKIVSLHMFFVFYPILVIFVNKKNIVVEKVFLRPFEIYVPKNKAIYVLEIAVDDDVKNFSKIKVGDSIKIFDNKKNIRKI
ncbi:MAG: DUF192 domain-containing protein [Candidatus Woesearchaeota archaeon]